MDLRQGFVSTLATDHAPFDFATQKIMGRDDFTKIPNGIPSLEDRINLFYTHGVKGRRIDLHQFVAAAKHERGETLWPLPAQREPSSRAAMPTSSFTIPIIAERFPPRLTR